MPTLIELIASADDRYTVTVWYGLRMDCEREFTSLAGAVAYVSQRFGNVL